MLASTNHEEEGTLLLQPSCGQFHLLDTDPPTSGQVAGCRREDFVLDTDLPTSGQVAGTRREDLVPRMTRGARHADLVLPATRTGSTVIAAVLG